MGNDKACSNKQNNMNEIIKELETLFGCFSEESSNNFNNGNKAAGARARKVSLAIEKKLKEYRAKSVEFDKNIVK